MKDQRCVVIGASHAGVSLCLQLRKEGWLGSIVLVGEETQMPYHRPPMSKDFLADKKEMDGIRLRPEKTYAANNIELRLGCRVVSIDKLKKTVLLDDGSELSYDKLALCTGASACEIPITDNLSNVFYIRSSEQVEQLKTKLETARSAVIIGAGYIGLESAAVLSAKGLQVTVLEMAPRILQRVTGEQMSNYIEALHRDKGVDIRCSMQVTEITEQGGQNKVTVANGEEFIADLLIVGVGVIPNTAIAAAAGLEIDNGIVVDHAARTSDADIYAAGDCSNHPSAVYAKRLRLESVQNANDQARVAASNIAGNSSTYDALPWFWSDQYDTKLQMAGLSNGYDEVVLRGDASVATNSFALFYFKGEKLIAADCVNRPKEFMMAKRFIKEAVVLDKTRLSDEAIEPKDINIQPEK